MNLLFLSAFIPYPLRDGDCVRAFRMLEMLARRHSVRGFFLDSDGIGGVPHQIKRLCRDTLRVKLPRWRRATGVLRALTLGRPLNTEPFFSGGALRRLVSAAEHWRVRAVHVHRVRMMPYAEALRLPYMLDATDCLTHYFRLAGKSLGGWRRIYAARDSRILARRERDWANRSAACIVTTPLEAARMRSLGVRKPVIAVPNGMRTGARPRIRPSKRERELVFMGNLAYPPNSSGLAWFFRRVAPLLAGMSPGARLVVIGGGVSRPLVKAAGACGLRVRFTGFLSDPGPGIERASAMICPLPVAVGLQNKVIEAFIRATPVVTTSNVAGALGAGAGREVLVSDTPAGFARLAASLLEKPALRDRIGMSGMRLAARRFSEKAASRALDGALAFLNRAVRMDA